MALQASLTLVSQSSTVGGINGYRLYKLIADCTHTHTHIHIHTHTHTHTHTVYIVTDDQDIKLGSLEVQDNVRSLLVEKGISFKNAFVSTPVCCPSR